MYLSMPAVYLEQFRDHLERLAADGKKVVILAGDLPAAEIKGSILYRTDKRDGQLRRQQDGQQLHAAPQVLLVPPVLLAAAQRQAEAMLLQVVEMARQLLIMLASLLVIHMYMAAQA